MPDTNFPNGVDVGTLKINGTQVTATPAELNALQGAGAVQADLVKLHAITKAAAEINGVANGATANPQQAHEVDVVVTAGIDGADTVGKAAVLAALNALENKYNALLVKLETAAILANA
ncbi:MAG: hypothetical protein ACYCX4_02635 [Bacillota bacterium]